MIAPPGPAGQIMSGEHGIYFRAREIEDQPLVGSFDGDASDRVAIPIVIGSRSAAMRRNERTAANCTFLDCT
jgi:hypothetical protein